MRSFAVLGATGALGKATVDELIKQNIPVKILVRDIEKYQKLYPQGQPPGRVDVVQGDLDTNQSIATVMENVDTVFLCYNTNLRYWERDMINWTNKIANVASALEAQIIYPGCIYNYGLRNKPIKEEENQDAKSVIGQLKIALEKRLYRAAQEGANLTIVRLPTIFGPGDTNSELSNIFKAAILNKSSTWRGKIDNKHNFIYSIDAAKLLVKASMNEKALNKVFHIGGSGIFVKDLISKVHDFAGSVIFPKYRIVPKAQENIKAIFSKESKLRNQLRYINENEMSLDGSLFEKEIGSFQLTPIDISLSETTDWYKYWIEK